MEIRDILYYDEEAQEKLISGINKIANAVKCTMGPNGRYVILNEEGDSYPRVTKDGVSVANYIKLSDPIEDMGAKLMKQTSRKTVDDVSDGTTTATVITQALVADVKIEKGKVTEFRKGMEKGKEEILKYLTENKITEIDKDTLYKIALTSSNHDEEIAKKVSEIVSKVGRNGVVNIVKSELDNTKVIFEAGYKFDRGIPSSRFMNNEGKGVLELENMTGRILLLDSSLTDFNSVTPIIKALKHAGQYLVIVAKEFSEGVINNCVENCKRGTVVVPIVAAEFGPRMLAGLEDLGYYCDSTVTSESKLKDEELGKETRIGFLSKFSSNLKYTILQSDDSENRVVTRLQQLKNLLEEAENKDDKTKIEKRISQLSTGFAIIKVGGVTPAEIEERFDRYEDALGACKASLEDGILPGGGVALYKAANSLKGKYSVPGYDVVIEACKKPFYQILENSDITDYDLENTFTSGIDANNGESVDMIKAGIIDPYKVTVSALTNAVSIALMILSTGCVVDRNQVSVKMLNYE
jgi:chaperonin GroEL